MVPGITPPGGPGILVRPGLPRLRSAVGVASPPRAGPPLVRPAPALRGAGPAPAARRRRRAGHRGAAGTEPDRRRADRPLLAACRLGHGAPGRPGREEPHVGPA